MSYVGTHPRPLHLLRASTVRSESLSSVGDRGPVTVVSKTVNVLDVPPLVSLPGVPPRLLHDGTLLPLDGRGPGL